MGDHIMSVVIERILRYRYIVCLLWLLLVVISLPSAVTLHDKLKLGGFTTDNLESVQVEKILQEDFKQSPTALAIVFYSPDLTADSPQFVSEVKRSLSKVSKLPYVTEILFHDISPQQVSPDRHTAIEVVGLSIPAEESYKVIDEIRDSIRPTSLEVQIGGAPIFYADIERASQRDLRRAELLAIPIGAIVLYWVFGSIVAAALPLIVGGVSVFIALGLLSQVADHTDISLLAVNAVTILGLGLAVDYSLFIVTRFREEYENSEDVEQSVAIAVTTAGKAAFFSGLTVGLGLTGLILFKFMFLRSVGIAATAVVTLSILASITLLPALIAILSRFVVRGTLSRSIAGSYIFWRSLAEKMMSKPLLVVLLVMPVLVSMGLPFLNARFSSPDPSILPTQYESRRVFDLVNESFGPGSSAPITVVVEANKPLTSPSSLDLLFRLSRAVQQEAGVTRVFSIVDIDPRLSLEQYKLIYTNAHNIKDPFADTFLRSFLSGNKTYMQIFTQYGWNDPKSKDIVTKLRNTQLPAGYKLLVGGPTAQVMDISSELWREFPPVFFFVIASTYIVLLYLLRSLLLPLKAIIMNLLSICASFGALVWIFQEGHLSWLFRFDPQGYVESMLPILMFCILFGLSMDYEVLLLSRIKEEWDKHKDNKQAVISGLARSARVVTSAALIVVVVGLSFISAEIILTKALGLGTALAVLIDATLVRMILVPALMRLLGDWNWWMPRLSAVSHRERSIDAEM